MTREGLNMIYRNYFMIMIVLFMMLFLLVLNANAISKKKGLNELFRKAEWVILGTIYDQKVIFQNPKHLVPTPSFSIKIEGTISKVKVDKILYNRLSDLPLYKKIYIYQPPKISRETPILIPNKTYELFLKKDSLDNNDIANDSNYEKSRFFSVVGGKEGRISTKDTLRIEAAREFATVIEKENINKYLMALRELIDSPNPILRETVRKELLYQQKVKK